MTASWSVWLLLVAFVVFTTAGDVFLAKAMTTIGDLGALRKRSGVWACVMAVLKSALFWIAIVNMALSFFSLLTALNWANLSFVGPASSAMTFVANIVAARVFLREQVDRRRWIATAMVCAGILLIGLDPPK
ncbi:MAG TPA: hypothetical protein VMZ25_10710 [Terriglobales bacterium]|nr:hypothetical protein [Terriglobales bacterium]